MFGYGFFDEGFKSKLQLDWIVAAQLHAVSRTGKLTQEISRGQLRVDDVRNIDPPALDLKVPSTAGFYRFDIQFTDGNSNYLLGEFSEYLRVIPSKVAVRLGINARHFRRRQVVVTRVENLGTARITYGASYSVARKTRNSWQAVDQLNTGPFPLYQGIAGAGKAGRCSGFSVSADLQPGRYRIVKSVGVLSKTTMRPPRVSAEFWID